MNKIRCDNRKRPVCPWCGAHGARINGVNERDEGRPFITTCADCEKTYCVQFYIMVTYCTRKPRGGSEK